MIYSESQEENLKYEEQVSVTGVAGPVGSDEIE